MKVDRRTLRRHLPRRAAVVGGLIVGVYTVLIFSAVLVAFGVTAFVYDRVDLYAALAFAGVFGIVYCYVAIAVFGEVRGGGTE